MEPPLAVTVVEEDERHVVLAIVGDLDLATASFLEAALLEAGNRDVTLDLGGLAFMDSTGIRVFVETHQRLEESGRRLALRRCSGLCRRTLEIAGLSDVFHFEQ